MVSSLSRLESVLYSFKLENKKVSVGQSNGALDVTINGHTSIGFRKEGHVGDAMHLRDDSGQEKSP